MVDCMKNKGALKHPSQFELEPLNFTSYRQFLFEFIAVRGMSYRSFASTYQAYVSFPFVSKLLRRNSAGQFVCEVNLKPEKLAALLKAMGLNPAEISHLILVRLKNDLSQGQYKHSATLSHVLQGLQMVEAGEPRAGSPEHKTEFQFLSGLKALHPSRREKVTEELRQQLEIEMARSSSPLKVQNLHALLRGLKP